MAGFRVVLKSAITPEDDRWNFTVPNLPSIKSTTSTGLVKFVSVVSNAKKQEICLGLTKAPTNRATSNLALDKLVLISFADFRLRLPDGKDGKASIPASSRESAAYVLRLLTAGVVMNGITYNFFGHSNSQLKSRSCFLYAASQSNIASMVESLGNFKQIKTVAKKAKRIGLVFSSVRAGIQLPPERCEDIPDVMSQEYNFTDGCGLISPHLIKLLVKQTPLVFRNHRYCPSVIQIRYRGYKGVLAVEPSLKGQIQVKFRDSMRKISGVKDLTLSVVDHSRPYTFGFINDEILLLLHALGIDETVLLEKQAEHINFLQKARFDAIAAFRFLSYCDEIELAEKVLLDGIDGVKARLSRCIGSELNKLLNKKGEQRCRIMILKSRLLFGVCDAAGVLKEGECFIRITDESDGKPRTLRGADVIVTRNPTLHPGDIRKFRAVQRSDLSHLVDCIVFPTRGRRASADMMSGGDLDGDQFFVCWDPVLVPTTVCEPAEYPAGREPVSFKPICDEDRVKYFAGYTSVSLGLVKNVYMRWARFKGPLSAECQQLNRLFSQCVDGNHIKIPEMLQECKDLSPEPFILDTMHQAATSLIHKQGFAIDDSESFEFDAMQILMTAQSGAFSEFDSARLCLEWCRRNGESFTQMVPYIHMNVLSDEEKAWMISQLPPEQGLPAEVLNGLMRSDLLTPAGLANFGLDHHALHWKQVFSSSEGRMVRFLEVAAQVSEVFHKKLFVFRVDERMTLAVLLPKQIATLSDCTVDDSVRVFTFPASQAPTSSLYRTKRTTHGYKLYVDGYSFQLYNHKRADTWIFITRGPQNGDSWRHLHNESQIRKQRQSSIDDGTNYDYRASVAMGKISSAVQKHVGRVNRNGITAAEVYIISNKDFESLRILDLWLEHIDTAAVLPLFDPEPRSYTKPTDNIDDLESLSSDQLLLINGHDFSCSDHMSFESIRQVLDLLVSRDRPMKSLSVMRYLLSSPSSRSDERDLFEFFLNIMPSVPFISAHLINSIKWTQFSDVLGEKSQTTLLSTARSIALLCGKYEYLTVDAMRTVLEASKDISFHDLAELVEIIALTTKNATFASELLVESMKPIVVRKPAGSRSTIAQFADGIISIALEHVEEAAECKPVTGLLFTLRAGPKSGAWATVDISLRLDAPQAMLFRVGDHIRMWSASPPSNAPMENPTEINGMVQRADASFLNLRCLQELPPYYLDCSWRLKNCGSFVSSRSMIDALVALHTQKDDCCKLYGALTGVSSAVSTATKATSNFRNLETLNPSQNAAIEQAMSSSLCLLWGPPGTGKTSTVVQLLAELLNAAAMREKRILVAAPTHNAVDNVLRKFIQLDLVRTKGCVPLRLSTDVRKVASDLRDWTCDAFVGKDLNAHVEARRKAQKRVKACRIAFTTCIGSNLGLLRDETFEIVVVDEASQQTEPMTLVPVVKGCEKLILVGDHVQLRATTRQLSKQLGHDVSLFERLISTTGEFEIPRVMLDTQYRMHAQISKFASDEFYGGALQTAVRESERPLRQSNIKWSSRVLFAQCSHAEDCGQRSKQNRGQAELCQKIYRALAIDQSQSLAILTPYTRQLQLLKSLLPGVEVSSIDGFQGREADIVIFVTVRSNPHREMGFLKDMRRLNVAVTRARSGLIIIGDQQTLTQGDDADSAATWARLINHARKMDVVE